MHKSHNKQTPSYLSNKVAANADLRSRAGLRFASTKKYQTPRTCTKFDEQSFPVQDQLLGTLYHITVMK